MNLEGVKVTSEILWRTAILLAMIDVVLVLYLARFIPTPLFRQLKWRVITVTAIFWFLVWTAMVVFFWQPVYHYVFPAWARWYIPPVYAMLFALIALLFWWLALQFSGKPVITFIILGGLWGMGTHIWAIYRGILDKPPLLQDSSPVAASIMPVFEFVLYWCIILGIAMLWQKKTDNKSIPVA
jgi:hypothetical protein